MKVVLKSTISSANWNVKRWVADGHWWLIIHPNGSQINQRSISERVEIEHLSSQRERGKHWKVSRWFGKSRWNWCWWSCDHHRSALQTVRRLNHSIQLRFYLFFIPRLLNAYAEEAAIEDAIYYIGEALRNGVLDLEVFLKHVRQLSRKQFMLRAIMQKCRQKAGLAG